MTTDREEDAHSKEYRKIYREALEFQEAIHDTTSDAISDVCSLDMHPDGDRAVFVGTIVREIKSPFPTFLCQIDFSTGNVDILVSAFTRVRSAEYAPDGTRVAFLSDDDAGEGGQLRVLELSDRSIQDFAVPGRVEYFRWSPDGTKILVGVADPRADRAGLEGGTPGYRDSATWHPEIHRSDSGGFRRSVYVLSPDSERSAVLVTGDINVWEACWCGASMVAAIASSSADEGAWYGSTVMTFDTVSLDSREIWKPQDQISHISACPSGLRIAIVEGIASDRGVVAGVPRLIELANGHSTALAANGADITDIKWIDRTTVVLCGVSGLTSKVMVASIEAQTAEDWWSGDLLVPNGIYPTAAVRLGRANIALVLEGFIRAPRICLIGRGTERCVRIFDAGYEDEAGVVGSTEKCEWTSEDGTLVQGWLLLPRRQGPHPTIVYLHGGPIWTWRSTCFRGGGALMLIKRGFALFLPNPRGSTGRGRDFVARLSGQPGRVAAADCLAGIDHLIANRLADSSALGVTGASYGGFLTCWLICQERRFGAAVAVAPFTNFVTWQLTSHIPDYVPRLLGLGDHRLSSTHTDLSPLFHAYNVATPTLLIAGALDKSTPAAEAIQFYNAIVQEGIEAELIIYPNEGHGVKTFPAVLDYTARLVHWFSKHLSHPQNTKGAL